MLISTVYSSKQYLYMLYVLYFISFTVALTALCSTTSILALSGIRRITTVQHLFSRREPTTNY